VLIKDVVRDVLMKDSTASSLIGTGSISNNKVNVFRFTQSQDDPKILFWRPLDIDEGEWPYIFFLNVEEGNLFPNKDLDASV
jgi:hypothetical protein